MSSPLARAYWLPCVFAATVLVVAGCNGGSDGPLTVLDGSFTLRGVVVDAATGRPIPDAQAAPLLYGSPVYYPDRDRTVVTDDKGEFELRGVSPQTGYSVEHRDYQDIGDLRIPDAKGLSRIVEVTVRLTAKPMWTVRGVVVDTAGKPLAGVEITDVSHRSARSDAQGRFLLATEVRDVQGKQTAAIDLAKPGCLVHRLIMERRPEGDISVVLRPAYRLTGQVLSADGTPTTEYTLAIGPNVEPVCFDTEEHTIRDGEGKFALTIGEETPSRPGHGLEMAESRELWVSVRASGHAVWESVLKAADLDKPLIVRLARGSTVRGSLRPGQAQGSGARVTLSALRRGREDWLIPKAVSFGRCETTVSARGTFRLEHVRPDIYVLCIAGKGLSPILRIVSTKAGDAVLDDLAARGTGRVVGQVFPPRPYGESQEPMAFATGTIQQLGPSIEPYGHDPKLDKVPFQADKQGRFSADGVPAGPVWIDLDGHGTGDIRITRGRCVQIAEGKILETRIYPPGHDRDLPVEFVVGDGSESQFRNATGFAGVEGLRYPNGGRVQDVTGPLGGRVRLTSGLSLTASLFPVQGGEGSLSVRHAKVQGFEDRRTVIADVAPGRYQLTVRSGYDTPSCETSQYDVEFNAGRGQSTLRVPLGAGFALVWLKGSPSACWQCYAVRLSEPRSVRDTCCCGQLCESIPIPFLTPGKYAFFVHHDEVGYSLCDAVAIGSDGPTLVEMPKVQPGGTIVGRVIPQHGWPLPLVVFVEDSHGVEWQFRSGRAPFLDEEFRFTGLWPGEWTVTLRCGKQILSTAKAVLRGTETVQCDLGGVPTSSSPAREEKSTP